MASFALTIPDSITNGINLVRNDSTPENYCIATWDSDNSLSLFDIGTGSVNEMVANFPPNDVAYAFYRRTFVQESQGDVVPKTTKFC